jgi:hypothetical protein
MAPRSTDNGRETRRANANGGLLEFLDSLPKPFT